MSRYLVRWGHQHAQSASVETFPLALALFVLHYQGEGGAIVTGSVSDGLSEDERQAIERVEREERVA